MPLSRPTPFRPTGHEPPAASGGRRPSPPAQQPRGGGRSADPAPVAGAIVERLTAFLVSAAEYDRDVTQAVLEREGFSRAEIAQHFRAARAAANRMLAERARRPRASAPDRAEPGQTMDQFFRERRL